MNTLRFSEWLDLTNEVTIYHGTIIDNEPGILAHGLTPGVGGFVSSAYEVEDGDYSDDDHAVYLAGKQDLSKATSAMAFAIGKKLGKSESDVTDEDITRYGLLCVVEDPDNTITQKQDHEEEGHPRFAEPYDYYSREALKPNRILKSSALVRFLKRYHAWPITWTLKKLSKPEDNYLRGKLTANAIKRHPDKTAEEIRKRVAGLSQTDAEVMHRQYYRK